MAVANINRGLDYFNQKNDVDLILELKKAQLQKEVLVRELLKLELIILLLVQQKELFHLFKITILIKMKIA